jgi:hypothetical protein
MKQSIRDLQDTIKDKLSSLERLTGKPIHEVSLELESDAWAAMESGDVGYMAVVINQLSDTLDEVA